MRARYYAKLEANNSSRALRGQFAGQLALPRFGPRECGRQIARPAIGRAPASLSARPRRPGATGQPESASAAPILAARAAAAKQLLRATWPVGLRSGALNGCGAG